jgi:hypothetical protein
MLLRRIALCILIAATAVFGASVSQAASVAIEINAAPPPPRVIVVPPPRVGYAWVPGYWRWNGHRHVWVNGHWVRERRGWHWVPAHWVEVGPRWRFVRGHWER